MDNRFRKLLEEGTVIVFDGGMGTTLFDKGVFINRCFDQLNLTDPDMILQIHSEFAKAGASAFENR